MQRRELSRWGEQMSRPTELPLFRAVYPSWQLRAFAWTFFACSVHGAKLQDYAIVAAVNLSLLTHEGRAWN